MYTQLQDVLQAIDNFLSIPSTVRNQSATKSSIWPPLKSSSTTRSRSKAVLETWATLSLSAKLVKERSMLSHTFPSRAVTSSTCMFSHVNEVDQPLIYIHCQDKEILEEEPAQGLAPCGVCQQGCLPTPLLQRRQRGG